MPLALHPLLLVPFPHREEPTLLQSTTTLFEAIPELLSTVSLRLHISRLHMLEKDDRVKGICPIILLKNSGLLVRERILAVLGVSASASLSMASMCTTLEDVIPGLEDWRPLTRTGNNGDLLRHTREAQDRYPLLSAHIDCMRSLTSAEAPRTGQHMILDYMLHLVCRLIVSADRHPTETLPVPPKGPLDQARSFPQTVGTSARLIHLRHFPHSLLSYRILLLRISDRSTASQQIISALARYFRQHRIRPVYPLLR